MQLFSVVIQTCSCWLPFTHYHCTVLHMNLCVIIMICIKTKSGFNQTLSKRHQHHHQYILDLMHAPLGCICTVRTLAAMIKAVLCYSKKKKKKWKENKKHSSRSPLRTAKSQIPAPPEQPSFYLHPSPRQSSCVHRSLYLDCGQVDGRCGRSRGRLGCGCWCWCRFGLLGGSLNVLLGCHLS